MKTYFGNDCENFETIRFVDWGHASEEKTIAMLERYDAVVDDWMEKDYGIVSWVKVPSENFTELKMEIQNRADYDLRVPEID
jgi:hypothetical protein